MTQMNKQNVGPRTGCACCCDIGDRLKPDFFKALCDPTRIGLLIQLATSGEAQTVSQVAEQVPVDISVVSRHLAILRDAGILRVQRQGKEVRYSARYEGVVSTLRGMADAIEACCPSQAGRGTATGSIEAVQDES